MSRTHLTLDQVHQIVPAPREVIDALKDKLDDHDDAIDALEVSGGAAIYVDGPPNGVVTAAVGTLGMNTNAEGVFFGGEAGLYYCFGADGVAPGDVWTPASGVFGPINRLGNEDAPTNAEVTCGNGQTGIYATDLIGLNSNAIHINALNGQIIVSASDIQLQTLEPDQPLSLGGVAGKIGFLSATPVVRQPIGAVAAATPIGAALVALGLCSADEP